MTGEAEGPTTARAASAEERGAMAKDSRRRCRTSAIARDAYRSAEFRKTKPRDRSRCEALLGSTVTVQAPTGERLAGGKLAPQREGEVAGGCNISRRPEVPPRARDWARIEGDEGVIGITWFAQDALGEIVHYEPPAQGSTRDARISVTARWSG